MDVSIVIVNYNTKDLLKNCLNSIISHTKDCSYEIIVVDNDSHDLSLTMLEDDFPTVIVIKSKDNLGFGRANNVGVGHAKGKYLFFLNSDTILLNDAVSLFFSFAEQYNKKFGALGCILEGPNGRTCHSYGKLITPATELRQAFSRYFRFLKQKWIIMPERVNTAMEVGYVTGADMFVPRNIFELTGGFDPDYFMYCEEVDWQKRMKDLNLPRVIIPGPRIIHLEGGSDENKRKGWSASRIRNIQESRNLYYDKHFNPIILPLFRTMMRIIQCPWKIITKIKN